MPDFLLTLVVPCQIFHEMEVAGVEANVHTFGAMIDGCARAGQLPKAFGAYGIMISKVMFGTRKASLLVSCFSLV